MEKLLIFPNSFTRRRDQDLLFNLAKRFSGDNPAIWVLKVEQYFTFYNIIPEYKLSFASSYLDGEALDWYHWLFRNKQLAGWDHFVEKLFLRFRNHTSAEDESREKLIENGFAILQQLEDLRDALSVCATKLAPRESSIVDSSLEDRCDSNFPMQVSSPIVAETATMEVDNSVSHHAAKTEALVFDELPQHQCCYTTELNDEQSVVPTLPFVKETNSDCGNLDENGTAQQAISRELTPITINVPITELVVSNAVVLPSVTPVVFGENCIITLADKVFDTYSQGEEQPLVEQDVIQLPREISDMSVLKGTRLMLMNIFTQLPFDPGKSVSTIISKQQMDIDQETIGIKFQDEIIMEILSWLPVWSLLRFKCVSKLWKSLISDSYFKMKHLNRAKNCQNSQKFLVSQRCLPKDDMFNFYCSSLSSVQVVEDEEKLDCPSTCKPVLSFILCCCDGLVLLSVTDRREKHLLLWNPSIRESIVLPHPESPLNDRVCGLGYDATSDDYKILAINLGTTSGCDKIFTEILALKSGSWRKNFEYPSGIHRVCSFRNSSMDYLAFLQGAFHWLGLSQCYAIVSFNISSELYGEIPLPVRMCNILSAEFIEHGVSVLGGMLCFYSTYNATGKGIFMLWVMKEYGVEESWTKLLTIQDDNLFYSAIPKHMYADGEVLLRCTCFGRSGCIYRTSRGPFGLWPQCVTFKQGIVYTESLISPKLLI